MVCRYPKYLDHQTELLKFIFTWEQWVSSVKFGEDAAKRPHVDGMAIWNAEDNLWSAIEPRLDICVDLLVIHARRTEVNDFDPRPVLFF